MSVHILMSSVEIFKQLATQMYEAKKNQAIAIDFITQVGNCIGEFSRKLALITHAHVQLPYSDSVLHMNSYVNAVDCYS